MYVKQEWNNGTKLDAFRLNHIENGIYNCSKEIDGLVNSFGEDKSNDDYVSLVDFSELKEKFYELTELVKKQDETLEKQKKEITTLKTKITKLGKKEDK